MKHNRRHPSELLVRKIKSPKSNINYRDDFFEWINNWCPYITWPQKTPTSVEVSWRCWWLWIRAVLGQEYHTETTLYSCHWLNQRMPWNYCFSANYSSFSNSHEICIAIVHQIEIPLMLGLMPPSTSCDAAAAGEANHKLHKDLAAELN